MNQDLIKDFSHCRVSGYTDLDSRAKAIYRSKCLELIQDGELRRGYLTTLISWADNYARYLRLKKEVEAEGYTFMSHNKFGEKVISANPKVKMMNDAQKMATNILKEFGATLTKARSLGKQKPAPKSALEKFNEQFDD